VLVVIDALANQSRRGIREKSVRSSRTTALVSRYRLTHEWVFSKHLIHYVSLVAHNKILFPLFIEHESQRVLSLLSKDLYPFTKLFVISTLHSQS
jgi:hypothetical protein